MECNKRFPLGTKQDLEGYELKKLKEIMSKHMRQFAFKN